MTELNRIYSIFLEASGVVIDSRKCKPGCLFIALKGERFDGNRFATQAIESGALAAIVDDPEIADNQQCILVDDTLTTLQQLATHHRLQFNIPIIGLTGSNGKTTTKNLISHILATQYECHYTQGNLNNHIGVPLTLLAMPKSVEVCVVEMGANHVGEIGALCAIARPTHGLVTNVGKAHLEGFGGIEGVKKGKGELFDFLAENKGVAFINKSEPHLMQMAEAVAKKIIYDGRRLDFEHSDYLVEMLQETPFLKVAFHDSEGQRLEAESELFGIYNFQNIATAISLGKYFRVPAEKIKSVIEQYKPEDNRSQMLEYRGGRILLDAYNANPTSMGNALKHFSTLEGDSKLAVLGDMLELGEYSVKEHADIADLAISLGIQEIILVGPAFAEAAKEHGLHHARSVEDLYQWWSDQDLTDRLVLLKGSRGMKLEQLIES